MSQVFDGEGKVTPVTLVRVLPNVVLQIKNKEKDGYEAAQVGFGTRNIKNIAKPQKGHFKEMGNFRQVKEFRGSSTQNAGDALDASVFQEGDVVKVSATSKAKGFQGVVKRHGFHGAPHSHGTKHAHREPGTISGAGGRGGGRVAKGMRMGGRMGGARISVRNLKIVKVDAEHSMLAIKGAVPGRRGTLVEIRGL